ncbi:MAG: hypothetical protein ACOXZM_02690 [Eubacteriales bacterium]
MLCSHHVRRRPYSRMIGADFPEDVVDLAFGILPRANSSATRRRITTFLFRDLGFRSNLS